MKTVAGIEKAEIITCRQCYSLIHSIIQTFIRFTDHFMKPFAVFVYNRLDVYKRQLLIYANRNFFLDTLFQGDQGLSSYNAWYLLHLIIQQVHQVFVVACIEFSQHGVWTGSEVALYNLRYFL